MTTAPQAQKAKKVPFSKAPAMVQQFLSPKPENPLEKVSAPLPIVPAMGYKKDSELPREVEALNLSLRPMIWRDLAEFSARHGRTAADMTYDLALLTSHAYTKKTERRTVVDFDLELLTRLYEMYPSSCAWVRPDVSEMFERLYGPYLKTFSAELEPIARLALGRRYARMLGRVDTAQYRWLSDGGQITRRLGNILSKIDEVSKHGENPLEVLESLAKLVWGLRGVDIDKEYPVPTKESVQKPPGTRGRRMTVDKIQKPLVQPSYEGGAFV